MNGFWPIIAVMLMLMITIVLVGSAYLVILRYSPTDNDMKILCEQLNSELNGSSYETLISGCRICKTVGNENFCSEWLKK